MKPLLALMACVALPALAVEPELRPSARLLFKDPELMQVGRCVRYDEGGSGWVITDPVFYLKGEVIGSEIVTRHLGRCPVVPGKNMQQYTRDEFVRHAKAYPCVSDKVPERDEQIGIVRLKVTDWETPHARGAANAGRLYRGQFLDRKLEKGMEIELEADLLGTCR